MIFSSLLLLQDDFHDGIDISLIHIIIAVHVSVGGIVIVRLVAINGINHFHDIGSINLSIIVSITL